MSSSVHIDNKEKILLVKVQHKNQMRVHYQQKLSIQIILNTVNNFESLHYNGSKRFLFVSATEIYHFKVCDSEIKKYVSHVFRKYFIRGHS